MRGEGKYIFVPASTAKTRACTLLSHLALLPLSYMRPFGEASRVNKEELNIGDVVWIYTRLDMQDIANPESEMAEK